MRLEEYLNKFPEGKARSNFRKQFAKEIGASDAAVWKWLRGDRRPHIRYLDKIVEATGGRVTKEDLRPDMSFKNKG